MKKRTRYPGVHDLGDGRYLLRVKTRDTKTGRNVIRKRIVRAKNAGAAAAMREHLRGEMAREPRRAARVRLDDAATSWLRSKAPALKPSTRELYASVLDLHILPALGALFVDRIEADDVVRFRDAQADSGISPVTVNDRMRILRQLLADVTHELGIRNPAARVPSVREGARTKRKGLDPAELRRALERLRVDDPAWYAFALTLALTGARWGEIAALRWEDLDRTAGVLRIVRSVVRGRVDTTKTDVVKELPLLPELLDVLDAHRSTVLDAERRGLAIRRAAALHAGWVFPSRWGTWSQPSALRGPLRAACAAAGVPTISPHGLRYSFNHAAKRVAAADVVRALTGHVTEEMTTHYDWIGRDEKRAAVTAVGRELVRPIVDLDLEEVSAEVSAVATMNETTDAGCHLHRSEILH